jgi:hypothetical protein
MQLGGNLYDAWTMFDHVKQVVEGWTTWDVMYITYDIVEL